MRYTYENEKIVYTYLKTWRVYNFQIPIILLSKQKIFISMRGKICISMVTNLFVVILLFFDMFKRQSTTENSTNSLNNFNEIVFVYNRVITFLIA